MGPYEEPCDVCNGDLFRCGHGGAEIHAPPGFLHFITTAYVDLPAFPCNTIKHTLFVS